ncbi:carboxypeptidase-like regulatory domain-containing protein [Winogradskyella sp. MH6]|uniref:carboxypeptidase-like regulatory domain-containing protein n=1 Tax=Winogradskyella sp. MH6 TaxID=2929510 RepID=UPI001FB37956|nr:carboxypeptidase-like regulatory domain-containing protein [Winogradskyella sp. MH6]
MISRLLCFLLLPTICFSQTLTGIILDASTSKPLETVAVYFDNTTIGTTTDGEGKFSISYSDAIQSSLVISYLGYEKVIIEDYRAKNDITIKLKPTDVSLDEVFIDFDDGLTRKQKLRLFRKEFLGSSKYGKSCKILNEKDIVLRYDKKRKTLYANADVPIIIKNKVLQYEISFDMIDFEAIYRYVNLKQQDFALDRVAYAGTSYYKNLEKADKKRTKRAREKVYEGSVQHFMRSLFHKSLKKEGYEIYNKGFKVDEYKYFKIEEKDSSGLKEVSLKQKVSILYDRKEQSDINVYVDSFFLDAYGNYSAIKGVYFNGAMGSQRMGDTLPLDYGLNTKKETQS